MVCLCTQSSNDLFIKPPQVTFSIDEFKKSKIEYSIRFSKEDEHPSEEDKKELHQNIKEFFKKNVKKYIMILRSAVGGIERADDKLVLTLNVIDEIETELKYTFIHNNPQNIILKIDNKTIDLKDLESY